MGHDYGTRIQGINRTVVVVAIGRRYWQAILKELHAVFIVIGCIQIGSTTGIKHIVVTVVTVRPNTGHITQHIRQITHITLLQAFSVDYRYGTRRQ